MESLQPETSNDAADEGTLAHSLAEIRLKKWRRLMDSVQFEKAFAKIEKSQYYNVEMWDYVTEYVRFVKEAFYDAEDEGSAEIYFETRVSLEKYAKDCWGTVDVRIVSRIKLRIIDFKYGKGIKVEAFENKQAMLYALGALEAQNKHHTISTVEMTIHQPRLEQVTTYTMHVYDLFQWAYEVLQPAARLAHLGAGEFVAGSHCQFCKIKGTCRALAEHNLVLANLEFAEAHLLTDEEISKILKVADQFKSWIKQVEEHAKLQALNGKKWPGFKLVTGRSNRVIGDESKLVKTLVTAGYDKADLYNEPTLKGLGDLTKFLGRKVFDKYVNPILIKPDGAPTLVPDDDKRAAKGSIEDARQVFGIE